MIRRIPRSRRSRVEQPTLQEPRRGRRQPSWLMRSHARYNNPTFQLPDQHCQPTSVPFAGTLSMAGVAASHCSVGEAYDNPRSQSNIGLFKIRTIRAGAPFRTGPLRTINAIDWGTAARVQWLNARRLRSTVGTKCPLKRSRPPATRTSKRQTRRC